MARNDEIFIIQESEFKNLKIVFYDISISSVPDPCTMTRDDEMQTDSLFQVWKLWKIFFRVGPIWTTLSWTTRWFPTRYAWYAATSGYRVPASRYGRTSWTRHWIPTRTVPWTEASRTAIHGPDDQGSGRICLLLLSIRLLKKKLCILSQEFFQKERASEAKKHTRWKKHTKHFLWKKCIISHILQNFSLGVEHSNSIRKPNFGSLSLIYGVRMCEVNFHFSL